MIWKERVDSVVVGFFLVSVVVILVDSAREWWNVMSGRKVKVTSETPAVTRAELGLARE